MKLLNDNLTRSINQYIILPFVVGLSKQYSKNIEKGNGAITVKKWRVLAIIRDGDSCGVLSFIGEEIKMWTLKIKDIPLKNLARKAK